MIINNSIVSSHCTVLGKAKPITSDDMYDTL
jgi:hypothetical protein